VQSAKLKVIVQNPKFWILCFGFILSFGFCYLSFMVSPLL